MGPLPVLLTKERIMRVFLVVAIVFCIMFVVLTYNFEPPTSQAAAPIVQGPNYNKIPKRSAAVVKTPIVEPSEPPKSKMQRVRITAYCQMEWQGFVFKATNEEDVKLRIFYAIALECENRARPVVAVVQDVAAHGLQTRIVPYGRL